jgi:DNA polymerase-3 subunit gamma/tau
MDNEEKNLNTPPKRKGHMGPGMGGALGEKAKDLKGAILRLVKELKTQKVLIIISLILAVFGAVLSILAPDKLSALTDEISSGLVANKDNLELLSNKISENLSEDKIKDLVGIPKITYVSNIIDAILKYDVDKALENIDVVLEEGKDITNLIWEMIKYSKDILVYKSSKKLELYNQNELDKIKTISEGVSKEKLTYLIYELSELENNIKWSTQKTIMFQAGIIKLCSKQLDDNLNLEERVNNIEKYLKSGKHIVNQNVITQQVVEPNITRITENVNMEKKAKVDVGAKARTVNSSTKKFSSNSEEYWPQIVNDLKQSGKIVLYTNLMNTKAKEINDMTVGIEFPNGMTSFGKTVLEKPENIREISNLVSIACGKEMQIKYITQNNQVHQMTQEENLQNLANQSDIPFNVIE